MTGSAVGRCYACQCHYVTHPVFPKNSWIRFTDCGVSGSPTLYCTKGKSRNTHLSGCCLLVTSSRMFSLGTNFDSDRIYMSHGSLTVTLKPDVIYWSCKGQLRGYIVINEVSLQLYLPNVFHFVLSKNQVETIVSVCM